MIDIEGATLAATAMAADENYITDLTSVSLKAMWNTQIEGLYDLIFPLLHLEYPTREEVLLQIQETLLAHESERGHDGLESIYAPSTMASEAMIMPLEVMVAETVEGEVIMGRAISTVASIGYGL